jgi:hypothetical protein
MSVLVRISKTDSIGTIQDSRRPRNMEYHGSSFMKNSLPLAPWLARESVISKRVVDAMNSTVCLSNKERSPRRQVPPRSPRRPGRASCGSNPVTPSKQANNVFSLRSAKRENWPAICWLLRRSRRQIAPAQSRSIACDGTWITVDACLRRTILYSRDGLCARALFQTGRGRDELDRL